MPNRREFLRGLGAFSLGMLGRNGGLGAVPILRPPRPCAPSGALQISATTPFLEIPGTPPSVMVDGMPFAQWFSGDDFENSNTSIPFHYIPNYFNGGLPPEPAEEIDVAVVGGGLSGLASAYFLRHHNTVLFELRDRFGGNSQGEVWHDIEYSLGGAYFITPDRGSFLERFYHELGLHRLIRRSDPPSPMELNGTIRDDFWSGAGTPPEEQEAFRRYAEVVTQIWENEYPEIPLSKDPVEAARVRALDLLTFREDVEQRMGMPMTPLLAAGVQSYFFSSFDAPMEEISAACGWNFVAAEEGGQWVLPGGNARFVYELWERLKKREDHVRPECRPHFLRGRCRVIDVRPRGQRLQVTYFDAEKNLRSVSARFVIMAGSKHVAKYVLHDLEHWDWDKLQAINQITTAAYLVANVLLQSPIQRDFYDCFLLGDGLHYPMNGDELSQNPIVTDMVRGDYAREHGPRSVLTLYWPLSWAAARFTLLLDDPWRHYTELLVPQIRRMLALLDVPESAVRQVRLTRWGHAMPIPRPGLIAQGTVERAARSMDNKVFFANQDNWALPAVENSLLDAKAVTDTIRGLL